MQNIQSFKKNAEYALPTLLVAGTAIMAVSRSS
jgi:hypothetical protein